MGGQEHFYLETQACLAVPKGEDGEMEIFASSQSPSGLQLAVSFKCLFLVILACKMQKVKLVVNILARSLPISVLNIFFFLVVANITLSPSSQFAIV